MKARDRGLSLVPDPSKTQLCFFLWVSGPALMSCDKMLRFWFCFLFKLPPVGFYQLQLRFLSTTPAKCFLKCNPWTSISIFTGGLLEMQIFRSLLNQKTWRWGPAIRILTILPGTGKYENHWPNYLLILRDKNIDCPGFESWIYLWTCDMTPSKPPHLLELQLSLW